MLNVMLVWSMPMCCKTSHVRVCGRLGVRMRLCMSMRLRRMVHLHARMGL